MACSCFTAHLGELTSEELLFIKKMENHVRNERDMKAHLGEHPSENKSELFLAFLFMLHSPPSKVLPLIFIIVTFNVLAFKNTVFNCCYD